MQTQMSRCSLLLSLETSYELNSDRKFKRLAKALTRLRVCAGWSEPLLVAHTILLEISCRGSYRVLCIFNSFICCSCWIWSTEQNLWGLFLCVNAYVTVNNISFMSGQYPIFLGWTSTKHRIKLLQSACGESRTEDPSISSLSTQTLSHLPTGAHWPIKVNKQMEKQMQASTKK